MRLKSLNKLVSEKIEASHLTKTELAEKLDMSLSSFNYKYQSGNLEWHEIKRLGLPITLREFSDAMTEDLNAPVVIRKQRGKDNDQRA